MKLSDALRAMQCWGATKTDGRLGRHQCGGAVYWREGRVFVACQRCGFEGPGVEPERFPTRRLVDGMTPRARDLSDALDFCEIMLGAFA